MRVIPVRDHLPARLSDGSGPSSTSCSAKPRKSSGFVCLKALGDSGNFVGSEGVEVPLPEQPRAGLRTARWRKIEGVGQNQTKPKTRLESTGAKNEPIMSLKTNVLAKNSAISWKHNDLNWFFGAQKNERIEYPVMCKKNRNVAHFV
jgi:hypothetical protein